MYPSKQNGRNYERCEYSTKRTMNASRNGPPASFFLHSSTVQCTIARGYHGERSAEFGPIILPPKHHSTERMQYSTSPDAINQSTRELDGTREKEVMGANPPQLPCVITRSNPDQRDHNHKNTRIFDRLGCSFYASKLESKIHFLLLQVVHEESTVVMTKKVC